MRCFNDGRNGSLARRGRERSHFRVTRDTHSLPSANGLEASSIAIHHVEPRRPPSDAREHDAAVLRPRGCRVGLRVAGQPPQPGPVHADDIDLGGPRHVSGLRRDVVPVLERDPAPVRRPGGCRDEAPLPQSMDASRAQVEDRKGGAPALDERDPRAVRRPDRALRVADEVALALPSASIARMLEARANGPRACSNTIVSPSGDQAGSPSCPRVSRLNPPPFLRAT